jgi:hypothetical protein
MVICVGGDNSAEEIGEEEDAASSEPLLLHQHSMAFSIQASACMRSLMSSSSASPSAMSKSARHSISTSQSSVRILAGLAEVPEVEESASVRSRIKAVHQMRRSSRFLRCVETAEQEDVERLRPREKESEIARPSQCHASFWEIEGGERVRRRRDWIMDWRSVVMSKS